MGSKILLADDSITIQKVVNLTFADEGIEVVAVSNGDTAERRLAEVNPDLVLADIFMPGKNGYELCEHIKRSPQFSKVPVVLLIGAFEPFNEAEARRVHADAHLTKPFESRTLVETVRKLINVSGQPRTGPIAQAPAPVPEAKQEEPRRSLTTKTMEAIGPDDFPPTTEAPIIALPPAMNMEALNDAAPLDLDYSQADVSVGLITDAQSLPGDSAFNSSQEWTRRTDDLSFSTDSAPFQSFGLNDLNIEASELAAPVSVAVEEHSPDFLLNPQVAETPLSFRDEEEAHIDYGKPEGRTDYEVIGFDVDARDPLDVDASGLQVEEESQSQSAQSHSFDTTRLDMSLSAATESAVTDDNTVDTNPLEMPASASDVSFSFGEQASDTGDPASLLAVDEPLGDVLMDESARESFPPPQSEQPLDQSLTGEPFSIEFVPQETAAAPPDEHPETVATATPDVAATMGEPELARDQVTEAPAPVAQQTIASNEFAEAASFELVSEPVGETVQTESRGEPVSESTEPVVEHNGNGSAALNNDFVAYSTWQSEETQFAPIDIEARSVDESATADVKDAVSETERGFEFTPARSETSQTTEEPVQSATPVSEEPLLSAQEPVAVEVVAPETTGQAVAISPAMIDEIVRRVVAQMSDSVVREIAWEVVPDCVERVIKDMTRQEMLKR
ncbi:MAG TPA: response regulator [Blastocatellia bacterium]|nr:response regulator [Blastocatellia bacterium]